MTYRAASFICCISFNFLFTYIDVVISKFFVGLHNPMFFFVLIFVEVLIKK
jgi:hypothetical protein